MHKKPAKKETRKRKQEIDITSEIIQPKAEVLKIYEKKWTKKQLHLIDILLDESTKVVFIKGTAGTGKTLVAVYAALKLLHEKKTEEIVYLRGLQESSSKGLGFLPGTAEEKFSPFMAPLDQKLQELLSLKQVDSLINSQIVKAAPINFLRGVQFSGVTIIDEAQGLDRAELTTVITRIAETGKFIFTGDPLQKDCRNSGFMDFYNLFNNEESQSKGIHCFEFNKDDIMRSKILKFICEKLEKLN